MHLFSKEPPKKIPPPRGALPQAPVGRDSPRCGSCVKINTELVGPHRSGPPVRIGPVRGRSGPQKSPLRTGALEKVAFAVDPASSKFVNKIEISKIVSYSVQYINELKMYICWRTSLLTGIRHMMSGKGSGTNQEPFLRRDAEFRAPRFWVPQTIKVDRS